MSILHIISLILMLCGLLFFTGGAVGILRFPDFYSRLHPAGKLDTMGLFMSMTGMALYTYTIDGFSFYSLLTSLKIMLIVVFVFITSPTATHAIVDAGVRAGLLPWEKRETLGEIETTHHADTSKGFMPNIREGKKEN